MNVKQLLNSSIIQYPKISDIAQVITTKKLLSIEDTSLFYFIDSQNEFKNDSFELPNTVTPPIPLDDLVDSKIQKEDHFKIWSDSRWIKRKLIDRFIKEYQEKQHELSDLLYVCNRRCSNIALLYKNNEIKLHRLNFNKITPEQAIRAGYLVESYDYNDEILGSIELILLRL